MSEGKCPLGEDCDLTLAYMMGAEKAKDAITALRAEIEGWAKREREVIDAIPPHYLRDPPDGGDVKLHEGVQRMAAENDRLRAALQEVKPLVLGANHSEARYPKARALIVAHPIGEKHDLQTDSMVTISGAEYEALRAENGRLLAANRDVMLHWDGLKADYERLREVLVKAYEEAAAAGYRETQWPLPQIRTALAAQPTHTDDKRAFSTFTNSENTAQPANEKPMSEAQLRRISFLRSIAKDRDADIERLTAERSRLIDRIDKRDAEIRRLRAALEYIAKGGLAYPEKHARAALEKASHDHSPMPPVRRDE